MPPVSVSLKYRANAQQPVTPPFWVELCLLLSIPFRYQPDTRRVVKVPRWADVLFCLGISLYFVPKHEKKTSLWTPAFSSVFIIKFCLSGVNYLLVPVMVVYGKQFGTVQAAGLAVAIFVIPVILVRPIAGHLCDRFGSKTLMLLIIALMAISFMGYWNVTSYWQLIVFRILDGLAYGVVSPPLDTISTGVIQSSRWRESHACLGVAGTLAMAFFSTVGIFLVGKDCIAIIFLLGIVITMLSFCLVFRLPDTKQMKSAKTEKGAEWGGSIWDTVRIMTPYGAIWAFVTVYLGCTITYIIPYTREMGYYGQDWVAMMAYTLVVIAIRPFLGRLVDRYEKMQLWLSVFAMICFMTGALLLCVEGLIPFFVAFVLNGIAYGCLAPCVYPLAKTLIPKNRRALGAATYYTIYDAGEFIASLLGGWLGATLGYQYMWLMLSLGLIPAFVLTLKFMGYRMPFVDAI